MQASAAPGGLSSLLSCLTAAGRSRPAAYFKSLFAPSQNPKPPKARAVLGASPVPASTERVTRLGRGVTRIRERALIRKRAAQNATAQKNRRRQIVPATVFNLKRLQHQAGLLDDGPAFDATELDEPPINELPPSQHGQSNACQRQRMNRLDRSNRVNRASASTRRFS